MASLFNPRALREVAGSKQWGQSHGRFVEPIVSPGDSQLMAKLSEVVFA